MRRTAAILTLLLAAPAWAGPSTVGGRVSPDGAEEVAVDLPDAEQMHNTGGIGPHGPGSGAGLCVFTSIEMGLGHWPNETALYGLQKYMTTRPGGGDPMKVDRIMAAFAPGVKYGQYSGADPGAVIRLVLKTGRYPCITYGYSPRYIPMGAPNGLISHMVDCPHLTDKWGAVQDNNFPGTYEWMAPDELVRRCRLDDRGRVAEGWVVYGLAAGPPPIPTNPPVKGDDDVNALLLGAALLGAAPHHAPVGAWGGGACLPAGPVGPLAFSAPTKVNADGCSAACTCGCNSGKPCSCNGPAPIRGAKEEAKGLELLVVSASWCGPCKSLHAELDRHPDALKDAGASVRTLTDDADAVKQYGVKAYPTLILLRDGKEVARRVGNATAADLAAWVKDHAPAPEARGDDPKPDAPAPGDFGVSRDKIPAGESWSVNGVELEARAAREMLAPGVDPIDDSKKQRLTIIGAVDECKKVLDDLDADPTLAGVKDKLVVKSYRPDHWAVAGVGFPADGHPTILIQDPPDARGRGVVRHHATAYQGAEELAQAVRRADPGYDPKLDPDLLRPKKPAPGPHPTPSPANPDDPNAPPDPAAPPAFDPLGKHLPACLFVGAGMLAVLYLWKKK